MEIKLTNLNRLLELLSWTKIIQFFLFVSVLGIMYGFWENRVIIYNTLKVGAKVEVDQPMKVELSQSSKDFLDRSAERSRDYIAGIQIVNVDFKKNIRTTSYFTFSDPRLKIAYDQYVLMKIGPSPLFTGNEVANQKIINLINGEFSCEDFTKTLASAYLTGASEYIITVCAISIPPFYGRFSGYMNIYLLRQPTKEEISIVRQISRDISLKIYETDINRRLILRAE